MPARVLLMYITKFSGHHRASQAVEQAIRRLDPRAEVLAVDAFQYFNPILARVVDRTYLSVIRAAPEIWGSLYDNPKVVARSQAVRRLLHRYDSPKLRRLLDRVRPTVMAATQAFPCGVAADYKKTTGVTTPLYGILTDFIPHAYWVHEAVDGYMVGSDEARDWLVRAGVPAAKIQVTGIPVDPVFAVPPAPSHHGVTGQDGTSRPAWPAGRRVELGLEPHLPVILVMGGGQGLGPIEQVVKSVDAGPQPCQLVVVTGTNAALRRRLRKAAPAFRRRVVVLGHVPYVHELMRLATLIVTKPGGLTTSEALATRLPLVIVAPIPGQESKNTQCLLQRRAAVHADTWEAVPETVSRLLKDPERLAALRRAAGELGRPRAALDIARMLLHPT